MNKFKKVATLILGLFLIFSFAGCKANNDEDNDVETSISENTEKPENNGDEEIEEDNDETDSIDAMIEESDYISKIKLITKGASNQEIKVLDNIKGNLSHSDLPDLQDLKENRAYVIFLKDSNNEVILTSEKDSLISLEGDNHELFRKINEKVHGK